MAYIKYTSQQLSRRTERNREHYFPRHVQHQRMKHGSQFGNTLLKFEQLE
jgi:hypothetical protein